MTKSNFVHGRNGEKRGVYTRMYRMYRIPGNESFVADCDGETETGENET